jgi:hypothetical protein
MGGVGVEGVIVKVGIGVLGGTFRRECRDCTALVKMLWARAESEGDGVCASASGDGVDMAYLNSFWSEHT